MGKTKKSLFAELYNNLMLIYPFKAILFYWLLNLKYLLNMKNRREKDFYPCMQSESNWTEKILY